MKAAHLTEKISTAIGKDLESSRVQKRKVHGHFHESLWIKIKRGALLKTVELLLEENAQLSVISGVSEENKTELLYHFAVGEPGEELICTLCVELPKTDHKVPTITSLFPGASLTEREKQEFFGIDVIGLADKRRAFLADSIAKAHPWNKNDEETKKLAKNTHAEAKK